MPMMVLVRQPQSRVNGKQRWYGHVLWKEDGYVFRKALDMPLTFLNVEGLSREDAFYIVGVDLIATGLR